MAWGAGGEAGEAARFGWKGAEGGCEMSVSAPRSNHPEEFGRRRSAETQREWASDSEAYRLCRSRRRGDVRRDDWRGRLRDLKPSGSSLPEGRRGRRASMRLRGKSLIRRGSLPQRRAEAVLSPRSPRGLGWAIPWSTEVRLRLGGSERRRSDSSRGTGRGRAREGERRVRCLSVPEGGLAAAKRKDEGSTP